MNARTNIEATLDAAGGGVLNAAVTFFTQWSMFMGIGLALAAVVSSVVTLKVPWTREATVWLYLLAATSCFLVHWADART